MSAYSSLEYFLDYCPRLEGYATIKCAEAVRAAFRDALDRGELVSESFGDLQAAAVIESFSKKVVSQFVGFCPSLEESAHDTNRRRALDILLRQIHAIVHVVISTRRDTVLELMTGNAARPDSAGVNPNSEGPATIAAAADAKAYAYQEGRLVLRLFQPDGVAFMPSAGGRGLHVYHAPAENLRFLVDKCHVDFAVMSSEDGFSPLGMESDYLSETLGVPKEEIKRLADWSRFDNELVTLVAIRSRREGSSLKGLILAPGETSRCYSAFATLPHGRPYRDFYYNVTYEAVAHAATHWGARKVGISHLSASNRFHTDIATCNVEAAMQVGADVESLVFFGCCISHDHLLGIQLLKEPLAVQAHRPIKTSIKRSAEGEFIHLSW